MKTIHEVRWGDHSVRVTADGDAATVRIVRHDGSNVETICVVLESVAWSGATDAARRIAEALDAVPVACRRSLR